MKPEDMRLSGADPDDNEDWRLAIDAVIEVARLREEYDAVLRDNAELLSSIKELEEKLEFLSNRYESTLNKQVSQ